MADTVSPATPSQERPIHKRSRSAVLKSLVMPTRTPSPIKQSPTKSHTRGHNVDLGSPIKTPGAASLLHSNHSHHPILGERNQNRESNSRSPHKRSMRTNDGRDDESQFYRGQSMSPSKRRQPLANSKEKENTTPLSSGVIEARAPIWAQFSSQKAKSSLSSPHRPSVSRDETHTSPLRLAPDVRPLSNIGIKDFVKPPSSASSTLLSNSLSNKIWDDDLGDRPSSKSSASSRASDKMGKVAAAVAVINGKAYDSSKSPTIRKDELDSALEAVLIKRNIPEKMRQTMRNLDPIIKGDFIRHSTEEEVKPEEAVMQKDSLWSTLRRGRSRSVAEQQKSATGTPSSPSKRDRSRGRAVAVNYGSETSPSKRPRSTSRPRSMFSLKNLSSTSVHKAGLDGTAESKEGPLSPRIGENAELYRRPADFVDYLRGTSKVQSVDVEMLHKLRIRLRSESVSWVDTFVLKEGMKQLLELLRSVRVMEWRSEHDDLVLKEVLLCLKGLCTTQRAFDKLAEVAPTLFPDLLGMLFDDERRGPSEFDTRGIVINLLYTHLKMSGLLEKEERARFILSYLADPSPPHSERPPEFVLGMTKTRPYQRWCKEIGGVIKEVFWIFIHYTNVVALPSEQEQKQSSNVTTDESYLDRHFPRQRQPEALNPWVGGVEWDATTYLAAHMDLVNGLIASLPTQEERNKVREELKISGLERAISSLRLCKEKFYPAPHEVMREWVAAAVADGWWVDDVRMGVQVVESASPTKSPSKENKPPPKLDLPGFDALKDDQWLG